MFESICIRCRLRLYSNMPWAVRSSLLGRVLMALRIQTKRTNRCDNAVVPPFDALQCLRKAFIVSIQFRRPLFPIICGCKIPPRGWLFG